MTEEQPQQTETASRSVEETPQPTVMALVAQLLAQYEYHLLALRQLVGLELKLSVRCLLLTLLLAVCFTTALAITWVLLVGSAAYGLFLLGAPPWALLVGALVLHIGVAVWLWRATTQIAGRIGLPRSTEAVKQTISANFTSAEEEAPRQSTTTNPGDTEHER